MYISGTDENSISFTVYLYMDRCPGQFCSNKKMKVFKTDFLKTNSFNNSIKKTCTKKVLKFALDVELVQLKFTYIIVLKQPKLGNIGQEFLKNYENRENF